MAVAAGLALLSTGVGALGGAAGIQALSFSATLFGAGASTFAMAASHFLVTTALGAALNALTPKPSIGGNRGYQVTQSGSALDHQVIYGKVKVGGARVFDGTTGTNNKFLHRVLAFTGHEIESFEEIYINDELVTLDGSGNVTSPNRYDGKVRINQHLGTSSQVADGDLVSEVTGWTNDHRLRGIAYLYVRLKYDGDTFPNGVPEITATIKGKKVYDPRDGSTAWSDNPSLCLRDYLTDDTYGLGEEDVNVDDDKVSSAANVCEGFADVEVFKMVVGRSYKIKSVGNTDFTLYGSPDNSVGTTFTATSVPTSQSETGVVEVPRYTCNGAFTTASTPYDTLSNILTSMGGLLWYAQGEWRMKPAYWTEPALTFDENDLRGSVTVNTRHSRRDNYNTVKGTFRGSESNWQVTDYPEVTNSAFLSADNNQESSIDLTLPFTDNSVEARRIANVSLERNRQQLTITASFGMRAFQLQVGDNVKINNTRFGWTDKEFEVTSWTFGLVDGGDLQVQMILREISESVFDDVSDGVVYERDNTTLADPFSVPTVSVNTSFSEGYQEWTDGTTTHRTLFNSTVLTFTTADPDDINLVSKVIVTRPLKGGVRDVVAEVPVQGGDCVFDYGDTLTSFDYTPVNILGVKGSTTSAIYSYTPSTVGPR